MCQLKDLIINTVRFIYIYDLRVCLSRALSSGNMQNEIVYVGGRPTIIELQEQTTAC
jgi:hypothetical protein